MWEWLLCPRSRDRLRAAPKIRENPKPWVGREGKSQTQDRKGKKLPLTPGLLDQRGKFSPIWDFWSFVFLAAQSVKEVVFRHLGKVSAEFIARSICIYHELLGLLGAL